MVHQQIDFLKIQGLAKGCRKSYDKKNLAFPTECLQIDSQKTLANSNSFHKSLASTNNSHTSCCRPSCFHPKDSHSYLPRSNFVHSTDFHSKGSLAMAVPAKLNQIRPKGYLSKDCLPMNFLTKDCLAMGLRLKQLAKKAGRLNTQLQER